MKTLLVILFVLLIFPTLTHATDSCIEEKITIAKLQQQNADLVAQVLQLQFQTSQATKTAAKAEQERLEKLLPAKPKEPEKK